MTIVIFCLLTYVLFLCTFDNMMYKSIVNMMFKIKYKYYGKKKSDADGNNGISSDDL